MKSMMKRTTLREIKQSLGRYLAIFAIVALGVVMFAGLKVCKETMVSCADTYLSENQFFDYYLISSFGFDTNDADIIEEKDDVRYAEGSVSVDVIQIKEDGSEAVISVHSITNQINQLVVTKGRLPEKSNECVLDSRAFTEDVIGTQFVLSKSNAEETLDSFSYDTYEIVGLAQSPYYLNFERGTSSIGEGTVSGFAYIQRDGFTLSYDTEIFVKMNVEEAIYSDSYADYIKDHQEMMEEVTKEVATARYQKFSPVGEPSVYVLDRTTNVGYVCFENDSEIVDEIAKVFPIFFFAVAALVCMTTMTRMVEDQRTQIGILKALGYSEIKIMGKYLFYAGSAAIGGAVFGFALGTILFPKVIWIAYGMMYGFADLPYIFDPVLAMISLLAAIVCSLGATYFSCASQFLSVPAALIRPKSPKNGKRILLERVGLLWKRLSFLRKVSIRNVFRYKKRFVMMVLGISGCTALLVTALGLNDSIKNVVSDQYHQISTYELSISLSDPIDEKQLENPKSEFDRYLESYVFLDESIRDVKANGKTKSAHLIIPQNSDELVDKFALFDIESGKLLDYPGMDTCIITQKLAKKLDVSVGDTIVVEDSSRNQISVEIAGICKNYVYSYVFITKETYEKNMGEDPLYKTVYANFKTDVDEHQAASKIGNLEGISSTSVISDMEERFGKMMSSLDYVIIMVIVCAAALAFIVLYNLTNINITERIREIATIKVLGFYEGETASYVFRENFILTLFGALFGLFLGKLLHLFVMDQIDIDVVSFGTNISLFSFFFSVVLTFVFAGLVHIVMYFKLKKINMAESLKSVD